MTISEFRQMLSNLADCWQRHDYNAACAVFAEDVRYGDPTRYAMHGRAELRGFFENDEGLPQLTTWHNIIFDEDQQIGAAEYSYTGTYLYHGVVLIKIENDLITRWREYQHIDSRPWAEFTAPTAFA